MKTVLRRAAPTSLPLPCALLAALALAAAPLYAQNAPAALADSLVKLRAEVEQLNAELEVERQESRTELAGLAAQKAELAATVNRQELALRKAREDLAKKQAAAAEAGVAGDALKPVLLAAIASLRARIEQGIPFKQAERLAELDELRRQVEGGSLPPPRAANRLWAFYEDEFRITRENAIYSQTIRLGNDEVLADVAKVGSVMLFFRTADGQVGAARYSAGGWRFEAFDDETQQKQVLAYFDSLGKQIRQGWFELPNVLVGGGQ